MEYQSGMNRDTYTNVKTATTEKVTANCAAKIK